MQSDNSTFSCITLRLGKAIAQIVDDFVFIYMYIFFQFKPVECIECQKNKQEQTVSDCGQSCFHQYANFLPFRSLGFFDDFLICFVSFYIYKSWILSYECMLSKGKKLWGNVCLQPRRYVSISLHFFTPTCKFPFIRWISLETKLLPLISQMLSFFPLLSFWLSRFFKLCFRLSFQLVKVLETYSIMKN